MRPTDYWDNPKILGYRGGICGGAFVSCICGFVCCFMSIKTDTTQLHVSMVSAQYPHTPHLFNLAAIAPVFRVPHQQSELPANGIHQWLWDFCDTLFSPQH